MLTDFVGASVGEALGEAESPRAAFTVGLHASQAGETQLTTESPAL